MTDPAVAQPPETVWFLVPGDLDTPTGGYVYDRRIIAGLRGLGVPVEHRPLDARFPHPPPSALAEADALLGQIPEDTLAVVDGLAFGAMPGPAARHGRRLRLVALVHHPLAEETGLPPGLAERFRASERAALRWATGIVVTSPATASLLDGYGVQAGRVAVVAPGTDPRPAATGAVNGWLNLLCVGSITHRKGYDVLLRALATLRGHTWRLDCVGSLDRDPAEAERLRLLRDALGLRSQVYFTGALDAAALAERYRAADLFVLATRFEGYGMVFAEALAHGLPIVSTTAGAVPDTVPAAAGILVHPEDPQALASALMRLMSDATLRRRIAAHARAAGQALPDWGHAARSFARVLEQFRHCPSPEDDADD